MAKFIIGLIIFKTRLEFFCKNFRNILLHDYDTKDSREIFLMNLSELSRSKKILWTTEEKFLSLNFYCDFFPINWKWFKIFISSICACGWCKNIKPRCKLIFNNVKICFGALLCSVVELELSTEICRRCCQHQKESHHIITSWVFIPLDVNIIYEQSHMNEHRRHCFIV